MGKTLRVVCTNCDTPIDAETRQPQQGGPGFQHSVQEASGMQHANGLGNKIAHSFDTDGYGGDNNHKDPQAALQQSSQPQAAAAQQQHYHSQKQQQSSGCLKYEVLCPNPVVWSHCIHYFRLSSSQPPLSHLHFPSRSLEHLCATLVLLEEACYANFILSSATQFSVLMCKYFTPDPLND